jgi:hypothetical protein
LKEQTATMVARQGLREAEYELAFFTESARTYWKMWGPLGEGALRNLDFWAEMQRDYFRWVREVTSADERR